MASLVTELNNKMESMSTHKARVDQGRSLFPILIAKVYELTRNVDPNEYDLDYIAIGPYSYPRPQSRQPHIAKEEDKLLCVDAVISAASDSTTMEKYVQELAHLERDARRSYAHDFVDMSSQQFVRMLLLDGCYVLYRLTSLGPHPAAPGMAAAASIPLNRAEALAMVRDVVYLAENQLPFFVLEKIGELTSMEGEQTVIAQMRKYILDLMIRQKYIAAAPPDMGTSVPSSILHLLHMHLKPAALLLPAATASGGADPLLFPRWRSATDYDLAGVKFKAQAMRERVRCILDVKLDSHDSTLMIPCLNIDGQTWRMLRNLVSPERRNRETVGSHVTAYCVFMSQLACTTKDVELLVKKDIIVHGHGNDEEVAQCFVDFCKGIQFDPSDAENNYLLEICMKMERRYRNQSRGWMAWLKRRYFSNPWLTIGLIVGFILLLCAILQTVFSALGYYKG